VTRRRIRDEVDPELIEGQREAPASLARPPEEAPTLLRDPRLLARQSDSVRATLARAVQQGHGNSAFGRMLMRDPPAAAAPPAIGHKTGKEVDDALDASPFFSKLVEDKHKKGTKAEGNVHIHNNADFVKAYVAMALTKSNPDTGKIFTEAEATARAENVNAFQDKGEIHVHEARGEAATTVHESMHLFSEQAAWTNKVGYNVNEGTTEFFTKKLCAEIKLARGSFYPSQHTSVVKLVGASSENLLADAYFKGKLTELEAAVDASKGAGTFGKWLAFMKASKYADADALL
jgi:hypothetical protein